MNDHRAEITELARELNRDDGEQTAEDLYHIATRALDIAAGLEAWIADAAAVIAMTDLDAVMYDGDTLDLLADSLETSGYTVRKVTA